MATYRTGNQEPGEQVPKPVEGRRDDGRKLGVRSDGNRDHSPVCKVQEGQVHEENEVEEFSGSPLELNH